MWYNDNVDVECIYCGKTFNKKICEVRKYHKHFCCREHYFAWQEKNLKRRVKLTCSNCGKMFERRVSVKIGNNSFCTRKCQYDFLRLENAPAFKQGRLVNDHGYVMILNPTHPRKVAKQYVYEHILVMEAHLGRYLSKGEVVHHINGLKDDNRLENLKLMTNSEHATLHHANKTKSELGGDTKSVAEMTTPTNKYSE